MHLSLLLPLVSTACALLEEQRTPPTEITWSGWVLVDLPSQGEVDVLTDGAVEFLDVSGDDLAQATQPYPDSPGYWQVVVPTDTELAVRITPTDPDLATMVWRGRSPSGRGMWLEGALFTRELAYYDDFFALLNDMPGVDAGSLSDGGIAHLWGEPYDPEAWAGASITVTGDAGAADGGLPADVLAFEITDDGSLLQSDGGRVDLFVALNLPEGTTRLNVSTADGTHTTTEWPTRPGELLSAIYTALPTE